MYMCPIVQIGLKKICRTSLYIIIIFVLGATCVRTFLLNDYMIAEKVNKYFYLSLSFTQFTSYYSPLLSVAFVIFILIFLNETIYIDHR